MKTLILLVLLVCLAGQVYAQGPSGIQEPAGITVTKQSWSKERINWEKDPFAGSVEAFGDMRQRVSQERQIEARKKTGELGEVNKLEQAARNEASIKARPPKPPRYAFLYKASFRNDGSKAIKAIDWDYVFLDMATGEELGRRRFADAEGIAPGKTREPSHLIVSPPTHRISAHALGKNERDGLREQVIIVRVSYADGTTWRRAPD